MRTQTSLLASALLAVTAAAAVTMGATGATAATAATTTNPLAGDQFYVQQGAENKAAQAAASDPSQAAQLDVIAGQSTAYWVTPQSPDSNNQQYVNSIETQASRAGQIPVFTLYAIPYRDCGSYSSGGEPSDAAYRAFVNYVKAGIGGRKAVVDIEPDALVEADRSVCSEMTPTLIAERVADLKYASDTLSVAGTSVFVDAGSGTSKGNPSASAAFLVPMLIKVGVTTDAGFELGTSGDTATPTLQAYGDQVSNDLAANGVTGKGYTIDTSRNGNGDAGQSGFCNLPHLGLGHYPSPVTSDPLNDAYLWVKYPGESDGACTGNGTPDPNAPPSGQFWAAYAVGLVNGNSPAPPAP